MKFKDKVLKKPNIAFNVAAKGQCYLEWVEDVHKNSFLSQKWKWTQLVDAEGKIIQTNQQHYSNRRGELIRMRWAGQTEAQLADAERLAREEDAQKNIQRQVHGLEQDTEEKKSSGDEKWRKKGRQVVRTLREEQLDKNARELFNIIKEQVDRSDANAATLKPDSVLRHDLKVWLTDPEHFDEMDRLGMLSRMNIFEHMDVGHAIDDPQDSFADLSNTSLPLTSPSQTWSSAGWQNIARKKPEYVNEEDFVQLCQIEREFLLPFELQVLVPLDEAMRDFGDKLLAIFCDVVKGVVNSDGWFLFPAGRRPRHQLIGDTIDKYGGELDVRLCISYRVFVDELRTVTELLHCPRTA